MHSSHCGTTKTRVLLNELYFWPGMSCDAKNMIEACKECQQYSPSQPHQEWQETPCQSPMEQVGVDLFKFEGNPYVAMMDRQIHGFPILCKIEVNSHQGYR